jgi:hypothetical protein
MDVWQGVKPMTDRSDADVAEARLAVAGWLAGLPAGAFIAAAISGQNPYTCLALFLVSLTLWATVWAALNERRKS